MCKWGANITWLWTSSWENIAVLLARLSLVLSIGLKVNIGYVAVGLGFKVQLNHGFLQLLVPLTLWYSSLNHVLLNTLRPKKNSHVSSFLTNPMKLGRLQVLLLPYPERAKKNKHFSENFMKIRWKITITTFFWPPNPNVIFRLILKSSHVGSIFYCYSSKNYIVTLLKSKKKEKKKNFSDLTNHLQKWCWNRKQNYFF